MRRFLFALLTLGLLTGISLGLVAAPSHETEERSVRVGEALILNFKGNKRAVHRWRLLTERSRGLDLVEVSEMGWMLGSEPKPSNFKASDTMRFHVIPKAPGTAELTFEHNYRGIRAHQYYFKYRTIRLEIAPAS